MIRTIAATAFAFSLIATPFFAQASTSGTASTTNREVAKAKKMELATCKSAAWDKYAAAKNQVNQVRKATLGQRASMYKQDHEAARNTRKAAFEAERATLNKALEARKAAYEGCKGKEGTERQACRSAAQAVYMTAHRAAAADKEKALAEYRDLLSRSLETYQQTKKTAMDEYLKARQTALDAYNAEKKACADKAS